MNYHFVGDVIAGAMLGSVTGVYMTRLFLRGRLTAPAAVGQNEPADS